MERKTNRPLSRRKNFVEALKKTYQLHISIETKSEFLVLHFL